MELKNKFINKKSQYEYRKKEIFCSMQFFNWLSKRLGMPDWHQHNDIKFIITYTAWKVSKYGIFHGSCFPTFGESLYSVRMQENTNQKKLRILILFTQCYLLHILSHIYQITWSFLFAFLFYSINFMTVLEQGRSILYLVITSRLAVSIFTIYSWGFYKLEMPISIIYYGIGNRNQQL